MKPPVTYTQRGTGIPPPWRVLRRRNQYGTSSTLIVGRANAPVCEPKQDADADMLAAGPALLFQLTALRTRSAQMAARFGEEDAYHRNMVLAAISESDDLVKGLT